MSEPVAPGASKGLATPSPTMPHVPPIVAEGGDHAQRRYLEFFAATIRNRNTREAYLRASHRFFAWCQDRGLTSLRQIEPIVVAAYIEQLSRSSPAPTTKQHLAGVRMLLDWLTAGGVLPFNPAASVRGPSHRVKRGRTPVLTAEEARTLLDSFPTIKPSGEPDLVGLRDRALVGVMVYSFARVSAAVAMRLEDYYAEGKRWWFRLHEKGGKLHQVPAHHNAEAYVDAWIKASGIIEDRRLPLFRTFDRRGAVTERGMTRNDAFRMIKRRARAAGVPDSTCCHTFRATGITTYLQNGGTLENAQTIAAHESARTTKLYDRTSDEITLDEIERILI